MSKQVIVKSQADLEELDRLIHEKGLGLAEMSFPTTGGRVVAKLSGEPGWWTITWPGEQPINFEGDAGHVEGHLFRELARRGTPQP